MGYFTNNCRYCGNREPMLGCCTCRCHYATQEDIELGLGKCDPPRE